MRLRTILPLVQIGLFVAMAVYEHRSFMNSLKWKDPDHEFFACLLLERRPLTSAQRQQIEWQTFHCQAPPATRLFALMNFAPLIAALPSLKLHAPYQRPVFYFLAGVLIGLWWFLIGLAIEKWRARRGVR